MIVKIAIIGIILAAGGLIFSSEIHGLFPSTTNSVTESLKNDVNSLGVSTADSLKERIDVSVSKVENQIDESIDKASESSKDFISETVDEINPIEEIGSILKEKLSDFTSENNPEINNSNNQNLAFETLSLSTIQQADENILLQYQDSSEKTESVNVIIKNSEKEIFSGKFFSSKFETVVNDASNMPYQIDMIVEHQEYGIVSSSVFNPGDSTDTTINGIFTQS